VAGRQAHLAAGVDFALETTSIHRNRWVSGGPALSFLGRAGLFYERSNKAARQSRAYWFLSISRASIGGDFRGFFAIRPEARAAQKNALKRAAIAQERF